MEILVKVIQLIQREREREREGNLANKEINGDRKEREQKCPAGGHVVSVLAFYSDDPSSNPGR